MGFIPEEIGKRVGNIVNGLPEGFTTEDLAAAKEAARLGLLEQMAEFNDTVVPEEVEWGLPYADDPDIGSNIIRGEE